jgi:FMN phosphatase YigB (HAD superfamily)
MKHIFLSMTHAKAIKVSSLALALVGFVPFTSHAKVIIWDIGYTLFKPDRTSVAAHLGYWDCLCIYMKHGTDCAQMINTLFMDVLSDGALPTAEHYPKTPDGRPLPSVMTEWFKGTKSSEETYNEVLKKWNNYPKYPGKRIKRLLLRTFQWMFDPWLFSSTLRPIQPALKVLRAAARAKDDKGNPKNTFYILSNLDGESFAYLYGKNTSRTVFKHFKPQNLYISGYLKDIKPHPSLFKYMIKRAHLNPADCIFIDDQLENVKTAEICGIKGIHVKNGDYHAVTAELKKLGAL